MKFATRDDLIHFLPHGLVGAEIGVQTGGFAESILYQNEPSKLFLIDCWQHQTVEVYGHDPANARDGTQQMYFRETWDKFCELRHVHVLRMYSTEAAAVFRDNYFDWVYFDANHLQVAEDFRCWWTRVKPGGWLAGHDYCNVGDYITVKQTVDEVVAILGVDLHVSSEDYPAWAFQKPDCECPI